MENMMAMHFLVPAANTSMPGYDTHSYVYKIDVCTYTGRALDLKWSCSMPTSGSRSYNKRDAMKPPLGSMSIDTVKLHLSDGI